MSHGYHTLIFPIFPTPPYHHTNLLLEEVRFGAKSKLQRKGVYLMYIPFRGNELGAEEIPYHHTNFLLEVVRFGAKSKLTRKGVYYVYIPFRGSELGAEDSRLSQEI